MLRTLFIFWFYWLLLSPHIIGQETAQEVAEVQAALKRAELAQDSSAIATLSQELGITYIRQNQYPEAEAHLRKCLAHLSLPEQAEIQAETHVHLGDIYSRTGRFPKGLEVFNQAKTYYHEHGKKQANLLARVLGKIGFVHINTGGFEQAGQHLHEAIRTIRQAERLDSSIMADVFITTGILHSRQAHFDSALYYYREAEVLYEAADTRKRLMFVYNNASGAYLATGNTPKALEYLQKSVRLSEEFDIKLGIGGGLNNIAMVHMMQEDYEQAISYSQQSLVIAEEMLDSALMARAYNTISAANRELGELHAALENGQKSLQIRKSIGDKPGVASSQLRIGLLYLEQKELKTAETFLNQSLRIWQEIGEQKGLTESQQALGELALERGQYQYAVSLCQQAYASATEHDFAEEIEGSCHCLARAYEGLGNYASALQFQKAYMAARDSVINEKQTRQITRMEMQYEFDGEKEKIAVAQQLTEAQFERKIQRQRLIGFTGLGALVAGLIILALLWRSYRIKQRANTLLSQQKATIQQALDEREVLLKEIHHRVKNNLQVVSSLLGLQSRTIEDPAALDAIEEGRNRVRAMALIHQNLYQEENLIGVDLPDYIEKLTSNLMDSYRVNQNHIQLLRDIAPISLDVDVLIPLGLILNELISNALKYAFPTQEEGEIEISIQHVNPGLQVIVRDNGAGLPQDFDIEKTNSLGFKLVKSFVRKIAGKLEINSDKGTYICMWLPQAI